jgi:heme exporter protein D
MIYWNSFADFLAMGGYGFYVWGSFGLTALIMAVEPAMALAQRKQRLRLLRRQLRADAGGAERT